MAGPSTLKAVGDAPSQTEMETLGEKLAHAAKSLEAAADCLQERMDAFTQRIQGEGPEVEDPRPQPGTLAALHYWIRRIDTQATRLGECAADVATIL